MVLFGMKFNCFGEGCIDLSGLHKMVISLPLRLIHSLPLRLIQLQQTPLEASGSAEMLSTFLGATAGVVVRTWANGLARKRLLAST